MIRSAAALVAAVLFAASLTPVRALAQTKDGYLWIGGDAGVSRFDGVRLVSFGLPEGIQAGRRRSMA